MLRRLHPHQPAAFAFTPANHAWAHAQMTKYPEGRQASAIIPILWRAQEQEGWLSRPAIENVADMLGMAYIRALEVATFYFMFQLQPVGTVAHIQVCGTTSCMIVGAEDLIRVCREAIGPRAGVPSADGRFSWEEVECLGACANAPMVQIGKDYYEDLNADILRDLIARFGAGEVPQPGSQTGRFASEPASGLTSLQEAGAARAPHNAAVQLAVDLGDSIKRIDGTEVPLTTSWLTRASATADPVAQTAPEDGPPEAAVPVHPILSERRPIGASGISVLESPAETLAKPPEDADAANATPAATPEAKAPAPEAPPVAVASAHADGAARPGTPDGPGGATPATRRATPDGAT